MNDTVTPAIDAAATAVVTGASSGIGRELALQLAPRVGRLILVARRRTQLEELARQCERPGLQVGIRSCDLGDREERGQFARSLTEESVDLLVCAAGFGADGHFDEIEVEQMEEMLEVNLLAAMHLTRAVLPGMLQRNRGTLVMVGSGAGVWPVPRSTTYCTTKAGLHGFCEALRLDLTGTGVHVTEALPGPVETEFDAVAGTEGGMDTSAAAMRIGAEECAREILEAARAGRPVVYPGRAYRRLMRASDLLPRPVARRMAARSGTAREIAKEI